MRGALSSGSSFERHGAWIAGAVAFAAALPGLALPYLSDDWRVVASVGDRLPLKTPYQDFRPLFMAQMWLERHLFGVAPAPAHLMNALLIAASAALVVVVFRRYGVSGRVAALAGFFYAVHPWHIECAAWVGARTEPLFVIPYFAALLAYDRWRERMKGAPLAAMGLLWLSLLGKETAGSLPFLLIAIGLADRSRRPGRREWARGLAPLLAVVGAHFLVLRAWVLGGAGRSFLHGPGWTWVKDELGFAVGSLTPVPTERLVAHPFLWSAAAGLLALALLTAARLRAGEFPRLALGAVPLFAVLVGPSFVGFEERYLFLPSAAAALFLAALLAAIRGRVATALGVLVACGWLAASVQHWTGWYEAGRASRQLVTTLTAVSREEGIEEIVLASCPLRVGCGSVGGDFRSAIALSGGRAVPVRVLAWVSLPGIDADGLDGPPESAIRELPGEARVHLRLPPGRGVRLAEAGRAGESIEKPWGAVLFGREDTAEVSVLRNPGRAAFGWVGGRLVRLF